MEKNNGLEQKRADEAVEAAHRVQKLPLNVEAKDRVTGAAVATKFTFAAELGVSTQADIRGLRSAIVKSA